MQAGPPPGGRGSGWRARSRRWCEQHSVGHIEPDRGGWVMIRTRRWGQRGDGGGGAEMVSGEKREQQEMVQAGAHTRIRCKSISIAHTHTHKHTQTLTQAYARTKSHTSHAPRYALASSCGCSRPHTYNTTFYIHTDTHTDTITR